MQYWLFKSEPNTWSWDQQVAKGDVGEEWDGIRNYQARNFMRTMEIGDRGFFYHSMKEKAVVGIVEFARRFILIAPLMIRVGNVWISRRWSLCRILLRSIW